MTEVSLYALFKIRKTTYGPIIDYNIVLIGPIAIGIIKLVIIISDDYNR